MKDALERMTDEDLVDTFIRVTTPVLAELRKRGYCVRVAHGDITIIDKSAVEHVQVGPPLN